MGHVPFFWQKPRKIVERQWSIHSSRRPEVTLRFKCVLMCVFVWWLLAAQTRRLYQRSRCKTWLTASVWDVGGRISFSFFTFDITLYSRCHRWSCQKSILWCFHKQQQWFTRRWTDDGNTYQHLIQSHCSSTMSPVYYLCVLLARSAAMETHS